MRTLTTLAATLFAVFVALPSDAAAQFNRGSGEQDRVCFYQDIQYRGWEQCYADGDEVANLGSRRNHISSIRIHGRARVTVYEDREFGGHAVEFTSDVPDLGLRIMSGSQSWSDRIDSFRIGAGFSNRGDPGNRNPGVGGFGGFGGFGIPGNPRTDGRDNRDDRDGRDRRDNRDRVCVYEHVGYSGRSECWDAGTSLNDLARRSSWSDRISSIRVYGSATAYIYRDIGFRGGRLVVDRDIPDLGRIRLTRSITWNDQVSSILIESDNGRGRGRGRGQER